MTRPPTRLLRLVADIDRFIRDGAVAADGVAPGLVGDSSGRFDALARRAFALHYQRVAPFRRLSDARGVRPPLGNWCQTPAVPTAAFRSLALHVAEPREVFRSSGTSGGQGARSVHYHPFPDLYRTVIDATFAAACLPPAPPGGPARRPILSLVPSRDQAPESSLGFMCDHILRRYGTEGSRVAFGATGVDADAALAFLHAHRGEPVTLLATAFALAQLLDALDAHGAVTLAPGSTLMETGGFKGRRKELSRPELLLRVHDLLGVPAQRVVREYGMTELTGHLYTAVLRGGDPDLFEVPPWMRVRLLEPETLVEVPAGQPGLVAFFDLSNVGSAIHVVCQDLGVAAAGGLRWLGRAAGADLRGCSLTVEELSS